MTSVSLLEILTPALLLTVPAALVTAVAWVASADRWGWEVGGAVARGAAAGQGGFAAALAALWMLSLPLGSAVGFAAPLLYAGAPVLAARVARDAGAPSAVGDAGRAAAWATVAFLAMTYPLAGFWIGCLTGTPLPLAGMCN